ncbi:enhancer of mRNA-decapping protein 4 isoform X4 [Athalia rosae]|uniref:enhancer of mRNA-decapping protein 4 isoform X4 n=1 Tax=Athalia rosae TaxID=37344 RepID=UPI00203498C8|nr:enhancer of mRNA-decapping protein 4 isoform X4 [Athalia rosae]
MAIVRSGSKHRHVRSRVFEAFEVVRSGNGQRPNLAGKPSTRKPSNTITMIKPNEENLRPFQYPQTVEFNGHEDQHSVELFSTDVTIVPSPGGHDHGSSKVKLKNIVDFTWELRFYTGQLLAVHMSGKYLAYGIKAGGTGGGVVRVVYKDREQRALLRGMKGAVQDLAFAHINSALLACIDHSGSLFVHSIESMPLKLVCTLILQVDAEDTSPTSHRVIWCPYIPEDEPAEGDEVSKLLVLTRGSKAELWSVAAVAARLGPGPIKVSDVSQNEEWGGMMEINQHSGTIVEATFSPDGTALATASLDGEIKFFQVYMQSNNTQHGNQQQPRCLHQWRPHAGRPISSLFFLDDHKNYQPDAQFWRFAVTGCDNNSELKVWSCESWTCLQTIKFAPLNGKTPVLKAGLDLSAGYLLLSDIYNKVLYILSLAKDSADALACVNTISEFLLPYPILSFGIVDAGQRRVRPTGESLEDLCPLEDESEDQLVVRMYLVQPKSLQECHIAFRPAMQVDGHCLMDTLTHDSLDYMEDLPGIAAVNQNGEVEENGDEELTVVAAIEAASSNHNTGLNLMTPDAFSSPAKKEGNNSDSNSASPDLGAVLSASPSLVQVVQALNSSEPPLATSEIGEQAPASGGSSPSREVREIFSLGVPEAEAETKPDSETAVAEIWPGIPIELLKEVNVPDIEKPEKFAASDQDTEIANNIPKIDLPEPRIETTRTEENKWRVTDDGHILALTTKLDAILKMVQDQQQELRELRSEVTRLRQDTPMANRVESALARATQQQNTSMEQTLLVQLSRQQEVLHSLESTITGKLEKNLPQIVDGALDPLRHQLRLDVSHMDELMKENLTQLVNGAHIRDTLTLAAANAAKPALDSVFKEAFTNVLLPGMERACQTMFRQVQDAFSRGTREYIQNVDAVADKQRQRRNEQQSEALAATVRQELQNELTKGVRVIQEGTTRVVRDTIRENFSQHLTEISGARLFGKLEIISRSRATTPGPSTPVGADAQARVLNLLQRGQLNAAFQQALSASDLNLVVLVCERTEPSRVFATPPAPGGARCLLQQPVLLSLIQQLSADLGHRTELKYRWLEEAVMNLNPEDPVTHGHMGTVLLTLQNQLAAFVAANPLHRSARQMKMLAMAAKALRTQSL